MELVNDIINNTKFDDYKRIQEELKQQQKLEEEGRLKWLYITFYQYQLR